MILHCSYEELRALATGAELTLSNMEPGSGSAVAAPAEIAAHIDELAPRLIGDLSISTLAELERTRTAIAAIRDNLRQRMESEILSFHPAHEGAITLYFDYAHVLTVLDRVERMGDGMSAMIRLLSGGSVSSDAARCFTFPD